MTPGRRATLLGLAVALFSSPAWAQADLERIQAGIRNGQKVIITDEDGHEVAGRIDSIDADSIRIDTKGQATDVPYGRILRIDRPPDTLANGALIGLGAGALFGLLSLAVEDASRCDSSAFFACADPTLLGYVVIPAFTGGLGAAIGVGIDALIRRDREIYRRGAVRTSAAPVLGPGIRGAALSVSW